MLPLPPVLQARAPVLESPVLLPPQPSAETTHTDRRAAPGVSRALLSD